jgi:hypothetical protein
MPRCKRPVSVSEVIAAYPSWSSEDQERLRNFLGCQEELELRVRNAIELVAAEEVIRAQRGKLSRTDTALQQQQEELELAGLTDTQIAARMNCSVWAVVKRRRRRPTGRKKLRPESP